MKMPDETKKFELTEEDYGALIIALGYAAGKASKEGARDLSRSFHRLTLLISGQANR